MKTSSNLKPILRHETLGDHVLAQIRELLLTGKVMPGDLFPLRPTALALGVSMMPVREAVYQLVAEQALEVMPNRSIRVPILTAEQFSEVTKLRLLNEGYAVEQAAAKINATAIAELRALNQKLAAAMRDTAEDEDPDNDELVVLNKELHFIIYESAGMPMLTKVIEGFWLRIGPILNHDLRKGSERTREQLAVKFHDDLISALEQRDAARARAALHQDIGSAFEHIRKKQYTVSEAVMGTAENHSS